MKKALALILVLAMAFTLFAGCNNTTSTDETPATATPTAGTATTVTDAPVIDDPGLGPDEVGSYDAGAIAPLKLPNAADSLAVNLDGTLKYEIDSLNYPTGQFEYLLPLTTADDTYTYFDFTWVQSVMIPEGGREFMDYGTFVREKTGVHIAYQSFIGDFAAAQQQFAIALASDDVSDITSYGSWLYALAGSGTQEDMVDQNWFVNIADYRAYAPNFFYQAPRFDYDPDLLAIMWLNDEMVVTMGPMTENPLPSTGLCIRADWLERLGTGQKSTDIRTYDQLLEVLTRFKNEIITNPEGYPMAFFQLIEITTGMFFGGFDTGISSAAPVIRVQDKQVAFTATKESDYDALQMFLRIQNEGLGDPNFESYVLTENLASLAQSDGLGIMTFNPGEVNAYEANNVTPGARWEPIHTPRRTANQALKFGHGQAGWTLSAYGWNFGAKCKNIPLIISYSDYFYSDEGSWDGSWGIEGKTYYYDESGNPMKTDFVLNNEYGLSVAWFMMGYQQSGFTEPVRNMHLAGYAYPGGDHYKDFFFVWVEDYYTPKRDGVSEMDWPSATAKLTNDQSAETNLYISDANTWFSENYALFLDQSVPLTPDTWNTYVAQLMDLGYERYTAAWQIALEEYLARRASIISGTQN